MSIRPYRDIARRKSRVGNVEVGGDAHITVQSMTNTLTTDIQATIRQVKGLEAAGADIVRISCPDEESTLALKSIVRAVAAPIVADIHFHYKRAIEAANGAPGRWSKARSTMPACWKTTTSANARSA